jgi:hypothetical protein
MINIDTPSVKDAVTMNSRSPDWPFDKPASPFADIVNRTVFSLYFTIPEPDEHSTSYDRNIYCMGLQDTSYEARTIADTVAAAAEQAGLVLVPRQPSPRMADAVRQLLQTKPGAIFEEIWAAATLAAAADEEMWSAAFATADKVAKAASAAVDDVSRMDTAPAAAEKCCTIDPEVMESLKNYKRVDSPPIHSFQAIVEVMRRLHALKLPPTVHPSVHAMATDPGDFLYRSGFCILPRTATAAMIDTARELAPHAALETIWSSMLAAAEEEMGIAR